MKRLLAGMLLLALCACQPAPPTAAPVDWVQGSYCALTVEGNRLTDGAGKTLDVRGANLPSLAAMQALAVALHHVRERGRIVELVDARYRGQVVVRCAPGQASTPALIGPLRVKI